MTFLGNMPDSVPGQTINRLCGSSMEAIITASAKIEMKWGDCFLVGGIESMSRIKRRSSIGALIQNFSIMSSSLCKYGNYS